MPKIISSAQVKVPRRSAVDKSFKNILTTQVGTLTPICTKLLLPNSDFSLKIPISASLPPLASDTFMRVSLKVEAFAVPMRLLYGGFESWLTGKEVYKDDGTAVRAVLPALQFTSVQGSEVATAGTLSDYLGVHVYNMVPGKNYSVNMMPYLCYHRIYDDWFRNKKIQKPLFTMPVDGGDYMNNINRRAAALPYQAFSSFRTLSFSDTFFNSDTLGTLHQRNYGDDYFTIATTSPQVGSEQKVTVDSSNQFSISALRAANSLQQFAEKNSLSSPMLQDFCKVNYGANLSSGVAQRSILLGSASYDVYTKGVSASADVTASNNPFASVAAQYGQAFATGSDFYCKGHVDEPCYLMVLASLVPEANYTGGISHQNLVFRYLGSEVELPNASFENLGNEPIFQCELNGEASDIEVGAVSSVFGYVPRYTSHKTSVNEVHGRLRTGQSLASFVAQRSPFGMGSVVISDSFLKIPTTALDNVTAVTADTSTYGCWIDAFVDLKVSEPLSECALPSLQDPAWEHGETVSVRRNGTHL